MEAEVRIEWPTFDRHRSRWLAFQRYVRSEGVEQPGLIDLASGTSILGQPCTYIGHDDMHTEAPCLVPACADLRLLWCDALCASEPVPLLLVERPTALHRNSEAIVLECWQLPHSDGEKREGDDADSKQDGAEESGKEGGKVSAGCLRMASLLRTKPASAELRRLADQVAPITLELRRPCGEPLQTAANWRWLVLLDVTGVHILDFGGRVAQRQL